MSKPIDIIIRIETDTGFQYNRGERTIYASSYYPRQEASHLFDNIPFQSMLSEKEMEAMTQSARANFINEEIADLYDIILATCPQCPAILSFPRSLEGDYTCIHCKTTDEQCQFPDLF